MSNRKLAGGALYLLFFANTVYAVRHGFSWLFWLTALLTAASFTLDVAALIRKGGRRDG